MDGPSLGMTALALTPSLVRGQAGVVGTLAPGTTPTEPVGRPPNPFSKYAPLVLIAIGGIIVVSVILGRIKAARQPQPPTLEERLEALAAAKRAEREAAQQSGRRDTRFSASPDAYPGVSGVMAPRAEPLRADLNAGHESSAPLRLVGAEGSALDAVARDAEELAERLAIAMDARAARLEGLIREADLKIRRLEELRRDVAREGEAAPGRPMGASRPGGVLDPDPRWGVGEDRSQQPAGGARPLGGDLPRAPAFSFEADADPVQRQVFALADQGVAPVEIARRVNQPTGQVELMLALRGR